MASTLLRRGFRFALSSAALRRRPHSAPLSSFAFRLLSGKAYAFPKSSMLYPTRVFSSGTETLSKVLESEIQDAKDEIETQDQQDILPSECPFEIIDVPGDDSITLKREYEGEAINISVMSFEAEENLEEEENSDGSNGEDTSSMPVTLSLEVTIDKRKASLMVFKCTADSQGLQIDHLMVKGHCQSDDNIIYEGPSFSDLDEKLQNELFKYLEARGIDNSLCKFLQDYMIKKDDRDYLHWLKNMKEFIEA